VGTGPTVDTKTGNQDGLANADNSDPETSARYDADTPSFSNRTVQSHLPLGTIPGIAYAWITLAVARIVIKLCCSPKASPRCSDTDIGAPDFSV
jgi:hypothetical protein